MSEPLDQKTIDNKLRQWHYWWLVSFSLLIVITFAFYLPARFLHQTTDGDNPAHNGNNHMSQAIPDVAALERLPLRTQADRTDQLLYEFVDGVKEFRLEASEFRWEYEKDKWVHVWGYNGQIPGPEIRVTEGDNVRIIVQNNLPDATTVHWHGVDVPWQMDGVASVTQEPILPGASFTYEFSAIPAGTRFYHSHGKDHATAAQQLDMGLSGAFIIEPKEPTLSFDKEFTLLLDEWDIMMNGVNSAISHMHGAGMMGAVPEFNTFTINGHVFPYTDVLPIQEGDRVLVRFINVGSSAFHPMHLHGHSFDVVAKDGFPIARSAIETRNTITINPGETVDILINANNPGPWLLHCHHVHHAAAGMITLFQYEGYEPIRSVQDNMAVPAPTTGMMMDGEANHMEDVSGVPSPQVSDGGHYHAPGAAPHAHGPVPTTTVASFGISSWWMLLAISIVLIAILSKYVKKYIGEKDM